MANIKQIGMAAGTFSVALGIGFVMQNGDAVASRFGADSTPEQPARFTDVVETAAPTSAQVAAQAEVSDPVVADDLTIANSEEPQIDLPEPSVASAVILPEAAQVAPVQDAPEQLASLDPEIAPEVQDDTALAGPADCVPEMTGTAGTAAMVEVAVTAPCYLDTAFTVHHQGMMFTAQTDEAGSASFTVPALAEVSVVIAAFENGDGAVATTVVPDFAEYDRAVLQWQGDAAVMLSAYEGDARFGDDGHIHNGNPGDMARLNASEGGYLLRLGESVGDDALLAEVYTFPSGTAQNAADVMLVAEAEITDGNCGQEMNAQSIQVSPSGETSALDLVMTMPDCDAVGDVLILQNMFEDLTLAAR